MNDCSVCNDTIEEEYHFNSEPFLRKQWFSSLNKIDWNKYLPVVWKREQNTIDIGIKLNAQIWLVNYKVGFKNCPIKMLLSEVQSRPYLRNISEVCSKFTASNKVTYCNIVANSNTSKNHVIKLLRRRSVEIKTRFGRTSLV